MSGSKTTSMSREQILESLKTPLPGGYYVWDGVDKGLEAAIKRQLGLK